MLYGRYRWQQQISHLFNFFFSFAKKKHMDMNFWKVFKVIVWIKLSRNPPFYVKPYGFTIGWAETWGATNNQASRYLMSNVPQLHHTRLSVKWIWVVGMIIGVRQSLCTTEGWAWSVWGPNNGGEGRGDNELITRHCSCLLQGRWQVLSNYSNNLRHGFLKT